jgi:type I restriction enzyme S subunit
MILRAELDRKAPEKVGAGGTFEVISLVDDEGRDYSHLVDQNRHFFSREELKQAILRGLTEQLEIEVPDWLE